MLNFSKVGVSLGFFINPASKVTPITAELTDSPNFVKKSKGFGLKKSIVYAVRSLLPKRVYKSEPGKPFSHAEHTAPKL